MMILVKISTCSVTQHQILVIIEAVPTRTIFKGNVYILYNFFYIILLPYHLPPFFFRSFLLNIFWLLLDGIQEFMNSHHVVLEIHIVPMIIPHVNQELLLVELVNW